LLESLHKENNDDVKLTVESLLPLTVMDIKTLDQLRDQQQQYQAMEPVKKHLEEKIIENNFPWIHSADKHETKSDRHSQIPLATSVPQKHKWGGPLVSAWHVPQHIYRPHEDSWTNDGLDIESGNEVPPPSWVVEDSKVFESKIDTVAEMFSDIPRHIIACKLEENQDNVEVTIDNLLRATKNGTKKLKQQLEHPQNVPQIPTPKPVHVEGHWKINKDLQQETMDLVSSLKMQKLKEQFHWIENEILEAVFHFCAFNLNQTMKALGELYPYIMVNNSPEQEEKEQSNEEVNVFKRKKQDRREQHQLSKIEDAEFTEVPPKRKTKIQTKGNNRSKRRELSTRSQ